MTVALSIESWIGKCQDKFFTILQKNYLYEQIIAQELLILARLGLGLMVYALPVGRGKQFASGANRIADGVVGDWKISASVLSHSGLPQTITGPGNNSNSYGSSRANQYRPLKIVDQSITHWFGTDPSATPCTAFHRTSYPTQREV
jgi:hypothetical protein